MCVFFTPTFNKCTFPQVFSLSSPHLLGWTPSLEAPLHVLQLLIDSEICDCNNGVSLFLSHVLSYGCIGLTIIMKKTKFFPPGVIPQHIQHASRVSARKGHQVKTPWCTILEVRLPCLAEDTASTVKPWATQETIVAGFPGGRLSFPRVYGTHLIGAHQEVARQSSLSISC